MLCLNIVTNNYRTTPAGAPLVRETAGPHMPNQQHVRAESPLSQGPNYLLNCVRD